MWVLNHLWAMLIIKFNGGRIDAFQLSLFPLPSETLESPTTSTFAVATRPWLASPSVDTVIMISSKIFTQISWSEFLGTIVAYDDHVIKNYLIDIPYFFSSRYFDAKSVSKCKIEWSAHMLWFDAMLNFSTIMKKLYAASCSALKYGNDTIQENRILYRKVHDVPIPSSLLLSTLSNMASQ